MLAGLQKQSSTGTVAAFLPLWIGTLFACLGATARLLGLALPLLAPAMEIVADIFYGLVLVYYLMIEYRMTRILESQPGWWGSYSPWGIVWRQLIPLYGLWVLYYWTKEMGRYAEWRIGKPTSAGGWTFLLLLVCLMLDRANGIAEWIGNLGIMGAFAILYRPLKLALHQGEPGERVAEQGVLGL